MFIFRLCLTSDDQPSNLDDESHPKCKTWSPNCQKMKCLLLDYVQLLMIGQAIQEMKVVQDAKKWQKFN